MKYLFDSNGDWIAFKLGRFIYNTNSNNIGWLPWDEDYVVDMSGNYLGHIYNNRFFKNSYAPYRGYPGYPGYPGFPGYAGYVTLPTACSDFTEEYLNKL